MGVGRGGGGGVGNEFCILLLSLFLLVLYFLKMVFRMRNGFHGNEVFMQNKDKYIPCFT